MPGHMATAKIGDFICVFEDYLSDSSDPANWYIGCIIDRIGSARNPGYWTLLQVIDIDNGAIKTLSVDSAIGIINNTIRD